MSEQLTLGERESLKDALISIGNRLEIATVPVVDGYPVDCTADDIISRLCEKNNSLREVIVRITLINNTEVVFQNRCKASCRNNRYMGASLFFKDECMIHVNSYDEGGSDNVIVPLSRVLMVKAEEQYIDVLKMVNTSKPDENDNFRKRIVDAMKKRKWREKIVSAGYLPE